MSTGEIIVKSMEDSIIPDGSRSKEGTIDSITITPQKLVINHFKNEPRTMRPVLNRGSQEKLRVIQNIPYSLRYGSKDNNVPYDNQQLLNNMENNTTNNIEDETS